MDDVRFKLELDDLRRALLSVPAETEREFVSIGERLQNLSEKAQELISMSDEVNRLLGIGSYADSEESLVSFVEITNLLEMATHNLEDVFSSLRQGLDLLRDIEVEVSKLPRLNRILRGIGDNIKMVGVNIKIKSATTGKAGEGFKALSQEVTQLSESIKENSVRFGERVEKARGVISTFLIRETAEAERYEADIDRLKNETKGLLQLLEEHMNQATELSEDLSVRAMRVKEGIAEVLDSLRFYDTARGQVESVADALSDIREIIGKDDDSSVSRSLIAQAEELNRINNEVVEAGSKIHEDLERVMEDTTAYVRGILEIMAARDDRTTIIESIESETENILSKLSAILGFGTKLTTQLQEIIEIVENHVSQMSGFIDEIEQTAETAKFLALNSLAEFIGTAGDNRTLMVLAQELRNLSREAQGLTSQGVIFLEGITRSMEEVRRFSEELYQKNDRNREITEEASNVSSRLHAASAELKRVGAELETKGNEIAQEVSSLIEDINFPTSISEKVDNLRQDILRGVQEIEAGLGQE